jgi:ABC-2 type transport system permease protein
MNRAWRIGIKDLRITARDRSALLILLAMPAVLILILTLAFGGQTGESKPVPTMIVNKDKGAIGRQIVDGFTKNTDIKKITVVTVTRDEAKARRDVALGDTAAVMIIPADFTSKVESGTPVQLEVLGDPGQQVSASIFAGIAQAIGTRISAASITAQTTADVLAKSRMVTSPQAMNAYVQSAAQKATSGSALDEVTTHIRGAPKTGNQIVWNPTDFYASAQTALFLLFGAMFGAFSFLRERREQTLARLLTTPATRPEIQSGKMLGIWIVGILQFAVLLVFTTIIGASWGSVFGATMIGVAEAFSATGLAMLYVAFGRTQRAVGAIGPTVAIVMGAVGGSWTPVFAMPAWMKPLHYFTPNGWALDGFFALQQGDPVRSILLNVIVLIGFGLAYALIALPRLRWE